MQGRLKNISYLAQFFTKQFEEALSLTGGLQKKPLLQRYYLL